VAINTLPFWLSRLKPIPDSCGLHHQPFSGVKKSGPGRVIAKAELVAKSTAKIRIFRIAFIFCPYKHLVRKNQAFFSLMEKGRLLRIKLIL
jgi:hypothetical protein